MGRIKKTRALAVALIFVWGTSAMAADEPFREMSFEHARQAAVKEGKPCVLVDFFTVWCVPCKKLDETTWKDAGVLEWLSGQAVCLKVDAEKEVALAEKYRINAYPTVLLIKPDGTEIDRLVGYRDAKTFLADARESLAGNDTLSRARKALEGPGASDAMHRQSYGDALAQKGRLEDALSEYLWCFDHGLENNPSYVGVRLSFLLGRIVQLGQKLPTALDELRTRRDAAGKALEKGQANFDAAMGFAALNRSLDETGLTLALYDRIKGDRTQPTQIVGFLFDASFDQLLKAKRYQEIVALDITAKVAGRIGRYEQTKAMMPNDAGIQEYMKKQVVVDGAKYYEALVGAKEHEVAVAVAARLTAFDAEAYSELIAAARRAGDSAAAEALAEKAKKVAPSTPGEGSSKK